jgi:hypothetical protein
VDIAALRDPVFGDIFITAQQCLERVSVYKELTTADLHRLDQLLRSPKNAGADITSTTERHLDCHSIRATAGQPLSEFDKVTYFCDAISADPACAAAILSYRQETPVPRDQTFANLSAHVAIHAPNFVPTTANIGLTPAFAAATNEISSLRQQLTAALAVNNKPPPSQQQRTPKKGPYCYLHGFRGHLGTECRNMLKNPAVFSNAKLQAQDPNSVPGGKQ